MRKVHFANAELRKLEFAEKKLMIESCPSATMQFAQADSKLITRTEDIRLKKELFRETG